MLDAAKAFTTACLGNPQFRRACTSNFTSEKVAFGEKNRYVLPIFPLRWVRVDFDGADINLDLNLRPRLPFADGSRRILYASHLVEHLDEDSFRHFLQECHRILAPGGALRIETPDAEFLVAAYRRRDEEVLAHFRTIRRNNLVTRLGLSQKYLEDHLTVLGELSSYIDHARDSGHIPAYARAEVFEEKLATLEMDAFASWCASLQTAEQRASGGHQNWMSWDKLVTRLAAAGFRRVVRAGYGTTEIPALRLNRGRGCIREKPHRAFYSIYVEAFN
jgi:SAM-dependent methyltransferase